MRDVLYCLFWEDGNCYPKFEACKVHEWFSNGKTASVYRGDPMLNDMVLVQLYTDAYEDPYEAAERIVEIAEDYVKECFDMILAECRSMRSRAPDGGDPDDGHLESHFIQANIDLDDVQRESQSCFRPIMEMLCAYKAALKDIKP